jgi:alpha-L-rhamnosidase
VNQKGSGNPNWDDYILKGGGIETWQPQFTYYGFRYLQVQTNANIVDVKGLHTRNSAALWAVSVARTLCLTKLLS